MSKTITLNDIEIINMNYNVATGKLAVEYALIDEQGVQHEWEHAIFWKEMPGVEIYPEAPDYPDNWYLLDSKHKDNKDNLVKDVKKILEAVLD
jgi:hypothetical protein